MSKLKLSKQQKEELEKFGANHSIVCSTHYVPADKYNLSPYKERF